MTLISLVISLFHSYFVNDPKMWGRGQLYHNSIFISKFKLALKNNTHPEDLKQAGHL